MRYASCFALLLAVAGPAAGADDFRVTKLEQDVRNLERKVQDLSREVDNLERRLAGAGTLPLGARPVPAPQQPATWLAAENWKRVREGMSELEVVGILGKPTSTRVEDGARILFYATEIGTSGVLGGRVTLRDGKVATVTEPQLK
jgi:hypothetical protein